MELRYAKAVTLAASGLLGAATQAATLPAAGLQVQEVANPPVLSPLRMVVMGRVQSETLPLPDGGFGGVNYRAQWPGTVFEAAFEGKEVFFKVGPNHEILHVVVDDQAPSTVAKPEPGVYRVSGLRRGRHDIKVQVATESQDQPNSFGGFGVLARGKAATMEAPARQIEFIGDSHTVGYGNTSPKRDCSADEVWATTDDTQAFGALTAEHYQAAYQVNAISGRGVVRNYNGMATDTLPAAYPYVLFDKRQTYHDPAWNPQVLVIALGTNDFTTPLHQGERWITREDLHADFEATYLQFLQQLRKQNPTAYIVLWATDMANGEIESEVAQVVQRAKAQGERRLSYVPIQHLQFSACNSHPSLEDEKTIRDRLVQVIDAQSGIWQGK